MIGSYYRSYGHGAARLPMPGIIDMRKAIGLADDLTLWELIKLGEIQEAFNRFRRVIAPEIMMVAVAGLMLFFMILISMKIHSVFGQKPKPEPIVIIPKILVVEKKEPIPEPKPEPKPKPKPKQQPPKIERKKKIVRKPPVQQRPKIFRKTPVTAVTAPAIEKNPVPEIRRSALERTDQQVNQTTEVPTPVRSTSFRPAQSMSSATIEQGRRPDVDLYDPDAREEAHISNAGVRSKREGLNVSQTYSQASARGELTVSSRGTSETGEIEIAGVSLASLEACPNSLDEIEFKKRILKVIGGRKTCSNATGEYVFYKTKTIASFNMIVKPKGGRALRNRCDELNHAYQCIITSRE